MRNRKQLKMVTTDHEVWINWMSNNCKRFQDDSYVLGKIRVPNKFAKKFIILSRI